ncbi:hypothetical protein SAMN05660964_03570 [Thiothrix caldifontis]|uniref:Uncharacterized protein n=1 Tax=Thiothrix caldifontis TaxID=525918 RepID=A0A1H4GLS9_9GAMM|nr:hypothetical protein [Thiothrix caldifontis]SEB10573.1 hypothetical protein SAMN05660964_03570 [Thiothrix caldifontis]
MFNDDFITVNGLYAWARFMLACISLFYMLEHAIRGEWFPAGLLLVAAGLFIQWHGLGKPQPREGQVIAGGLVLLVVGVFA